MLSEVFSAWQGVTRATAGAAVAAVAVLAVPGDAAQAASGRCQPQAQAVDYETIIRQGQVVYDKTRDKMQLTALFHGDQARMTTGGWTTVGLTESSLEVRTATRTNARRAPGGGWCANLEKVRVEIGYPVLTVYIPAEYRPGTCAHDVVHKHELEHVAITRDVLDRHAPALDAAVASAVADINPMWAATEAEAKRLAARVVQARLRAPIQALKQEHRSRNAAIDSAHNYRDLQSRCPTW